MDEGFEDGHEGFLVVADDTHDGLAGDFVGAVDVGDFHGEGEHAREAEGHALRVLVAVHGHFEAVAEVDVDDFAGYPVEHQVRGVSVAETEDVAYHGHHCERARVVGAAFEPGFRGFGFEPEDTVEIFPCSIVHSVAEDFDLLHECQVVVIRSHLEHDSVLDVE